MFTAIYITHNKVLSFPYSNVSVLHVVKYMFTAIYITHNKVLSFPHSNVSVLHVAKYIIMFTAIYTQ